MVFLLCVFVPQSVGFNGEKLNQRNQGIEGRMEAERELSDSLYGVIQ